MSGIEKSAEEIENSKSALGLWIFLMTDCIIFSVFFAVFVVLTAHISLPESIHDLPNALNQTLVLLGSSFVSALALVELRKHNRKMTITYLVLTYLFGLSFLVMEIMEFQQLQADGFDWQTNAALSSYFSLLGLHGLHITAGLVWLIILMVRIAKKGLDNTEKKATLFTMYWHFLDIIWIFIFAVVYLLGALMA